MRKSKRDIFAMLQNSEDAREKIMQELPLEDQREMQDIFSGKKLPSLFSDVIAKKIFSPDEHPERLEYLLRAIMRDDTALLLSLLRQMKVTGVYLTVKGSSSIFPHGWKTGERQFWNFRQLPRVTHSCAGNCMHQMRCFCSIL